MKRFERLLVIVVVMALALGLIAAAVPPAIPSSFYGKVSGSAKVGDVVKAYVGSQMRASTKVFLWNNQRVYAMNVPGTAKDEGKTVTFKIRNKTVGKGVWHSGTNVAVNLKRK